jgi:cell division septation protein DedD
MKGFIGFLFGFLRKNKSNFMTGRSLSLLFMFMILISAVTDLKSQNETSDYEDLSVLVQLNGYGSFYTNALYSTDGLLYISVEDLFKYLKVPTNAGEKGDILTGFLGSEANSYVISYKAGTMRVADKVTNIKKALVKKMGTIFLESSQFGRSMGINLSFNFRSLSLTVKSDFELPAIREQRLEKMRTNIRKSAGDLIADTILNRNYHMFRFGMADWSVTTSQYWGNQTETRLGLGLGAEVLKGEANLFLNYSDQYKLDNRLQQYLWRWVDNDKKIVSQIQVGKISPESISSLYYPVVGAVISNSHTSVRKAMGEYIIKEVTQPDWLVELYINNSLVDFTRADASGQFIFKVPLVYGYTTLLLKYYGPMGEERSENKTINIPYSFLPAGEVEYRISGGFLEDGKRTPFGRGETSLGVDRFLTLGMGVEYMASVTSRPAMPFLTASFNPMSKLIVFGEFDYGVRFKGILNYYPGANSILELDYTKYAKGQQAILYNYLEERKASFSLPLRVKNIAGIVRAEFKQNVYANLNYNMAELLLSAYYKQFNANLSTYSNWVGGKSAYMNSMMALSYRLKKGLTLRSSAQFSLTGINILSYKIEAEKRFINNGYISVSYENYTALNNSSVNVNFKYDLPFAQTNASARVSKHETSTFQNFRGSLAFGKGKKQVKATELPTVGRGGITIIPFIDLNHNGIFDKSEHKVANLKVKLNGGRIISGEKDTIINIIGLEPFINYNLELDDKDFENLAWRIREKSYKVLIDPNQFKIIYVPVRPVGEVSGIVNLESNGQIKGIGRILVSFFNKGGVRIAQSQTESDGYFDYLGLEPGEFTARIDSVQLNRLNFTATPAIIPFTVKSSVNGDIVADINFNLRRTQDNEERDTLNLKIRQDSEIVAAASSVIERYSVITDSSGMLTKENKVIGDTASLKLNIVEVETPGAKNTETSEGNKNPQVISLSKDSVNKADESESAEVVFKDSDNNNDGHFYVQLGAFRMLAKAKRFLEETTTGISYPSGIVVEDGFYKVRIGYFKTKNDAELCKVILKKKSLVSFIGQSFYFGFLQNKVFNTGAYYVGVGSFRYKINALQYIQKIKNSVSFTSGIIEEDGLFKVRLGYFETKAQAIVCTGKMDEIGIKAVVGESKDYIYSGTLIPEISDNH